MSKLAPERLRALRDRLRLRGRNELSFEEKVKCILEMISVYTFNATWLKNARHHIEYLRTSTPNPTPEQQALLVEVDARYAKRQRMIETRAEKKKRGEKLWSKKKPESATTPTDLTKLWKENNSGIDIESAAFDRCET